MVYLEIRSRSTCRSKFFISELKLNVLFFKLIKCFI